MTEYRTDKEYNRYVDAVINGDIVACRNVILACRRYKEWFDRDDMYFDYEDVDRRIRFVRRMKHFRGKSNGKPFILLPYQEFVFAGIFGFKWKDTGFRVTKNVLLFIARKNGKSSLAAAICLVQILLDKNNGQEIDFIASSGAQARLGFEMTKNYAESIDPHGIIFSRFRDTIKMTSTKSEIDVRNSDAMTLDGLNSSTFIADEAHSYKTPDLWNVLKTSQGFQQQPLAICISTAGFLLDGYFLFEWKKTCEDILKGNKEDDSTFSLLYSIDDDDEWDDENVWIKSNPSLGETVTIDYLRGECLQAKNQPSHEFNFRTKLLNQFCQSSATWIEAEEIRRAMTPIDLNQLTIKEYVWAGVDLSSTFDLSCWTVMMKPNPKRNLFPDKYIFKTWMYVTEKALERSVNKHLYKRWIEDGHIKLINGNVIDYDIFLSDMIGAKENIRFDLIGYDKYNATQFVINAQQRGLNMQQYSQALSAFNQPTKDFERLLLSGQVVIDYNPAVVWAFNNVVLAIDKMENIKPDKPTKEAKIDPVITMIEALGTYLYSQGLLGTGDNEIYTGVRK